MKNIFKEAHKMTREMVKEYKVDYQAQFGLNISYLLEIKEEIDIEKLEEIIAEEVKLKVEITINEWIKGENHRLYININNRVNNVMFDTHIDIVTNKIRVSIPKKGGRWVRTAAEGIFKILVDNQEAIVKANTKELKHIKGDIMHSEYLGLTNNMSSEEFEDLAGAKKFDESY